MSLSPATLPRFAAALVAAAAVRASGQIAVDLRTPPPQPSFDPPAPQQPFPEPELRPAAARAVLDDLAEKLRYLKAEARYLAADTRALWNCWLPAFGRSDDPSLQRLQARAFALYSDSQRLEEGLASHEAALKEAGRIWAGAGRSDPERLLAAVAGVASRINGLDAAIRRRQGELDRLYPRMSAVFAKHAPQSAPPPRPWHWAYYMDSNRRRPDLRVDFETLFRKRLEEAGGR